MAKDMGLDPRFGDATSNDTWLQCPRKKAEVARIVRTQKPTAGQLPSKPAHDIFWGGHSGFFVDPEGHMWEVAFNPFSPVDEDGGFHWNHQMHNQP